MGSSRRNKVGSWFDWQWQPMPADLGYHSRTPQYKDHEPMGPCEFLNSEPCYYDGSGLNAEPVMDILFAQGDEGVWKRLQEYYHDVFNFHSDIEEA